MKSKKSCENGSKEEFEGNDMLLINILYNIWWKSILLVI
jgi:hypothetical protein